MEKYYKVSDVNLIVERLLREPYYRHEGETWYSGVSAMADAIILLAPTFVEEPKVGKWVAKDIMIRSIDALNYICSECGADGKCTPYCPNCGAKMIKED